MQLTLTNLTGSTKTYLSGAVSVAGNSSTSVTSTVQQLSLATDGALRLDIFANNIQISDGTNVFGANDAIAYLYLILNYLDTTFDSVGNGITSTALSGKQALDVNIASESLATYSASISGLAVSTAAAATDILTITGSASKKITINQINISGIQTTAGTESISLVKRSTLNTGGGFATIVQTQNSYTTASSTTATVTVTSTGAGNLLIVGVSNLDSRTVSSVSDGTNSFTQATNALSSSGTARTDVWYLTSSTAGKTTITVTFSGTSTTKGLWFWEVSVSGISLDAVGHNGASTVGTTDTGTAVTTTNADIIVGIIGSLGTVTNSPATANTQFTNGAINGSGKSAACWVLGPIGTYTPSWNDSGTLVNFAASTAAFTAVGNNPPTMVAVPHDSNDAAATATVKYYLANPTLGTPVGSVRSVKAYVPTSTGVPPSYVSWTFPGSFNKGIVLNNANESLNINLNGLTLAGSSLAIDVVWTEQ